MRHAYPNYMRPFKFNVCSIDWALWSNTISLSSELLIRLSYHILPITRSQWCSDNENIRTSVAHSHVFESNSRRDLIAAVYTRTMIDNRISRWNNRCLKLVNDSRALCPRTLHSIYHHLERCDNPSSKTYFIPTGYLLEEQGLEVQNAFQRYIRYCSDNRKILVPFITRKQVIGMVNFHEWTKPNTQTDQVSFTVIAVLDKQQFTNSFIFAKLTLLNWSHMTQMLV